MAQSLGRPARPSVVPSGADAEEQLAITKVLLRRVWKLLEHRYPTEASGFWEDMNCDAHALVDLVFEAVEILWKRDRIFVEPCRRILDEQRMRNFQYTLRWRGGETRIVTEAELIDMAGLTPEVEAGAVEVDDDIPF